MNLTSVERLTRPYEDDWNHFVIRLVEYGIPELTAVTDEVTLAPIEFWRA